MHLFLHFSETFIVKEMIWQFALMGCFVIVNDSGFDLCNVDFTDLWVESCA